MKKNLIILALVIVAAALIQNEQHIGGFNISNWAHNLWSKSSGKASIDAKIPLPKAPADLSGSVDLENRITNVVEKSLPAVVTVGINVTRQSQDQLYLDPFNPFGGIQRIPGKTQKVEQNIGSGFIIREDGLIVTNRHVVEDQSTTTKYKVLTQDGKTYEVTNIYRDTINDLAILKIEASGMHALPLGDSSKLKLGQSLVAIGTPLGEFTNSVTTGVVSGLKRKITAGGMSSGDSESINDVIQTDAAINPGNSGGPLLNIHGEVIGVNTAVAGDSQNIGFATPVARVKELLARFEGNGESFARPYIGVSYQIIDLKTAMQYSVVPGAYIKQVIDGSPASKSGLQESDIITEIDGKKVDTTAQDTVAKVILAHKVGDSIDLKIWRDGDTKDVSLTIDAAP